MGLIVALFGGLFYLVEVDYGDHPTFLSPIYYSVVTITTLGYGDVVLTGQWRTLASIQAANGVIMFGWSTALLVAALSSVSSSFRHSAEPA